MSTPPPVGMSSPHPPPPPPPPSSSKKGCLIAAAIVVGVIVLLCGGGFVFVAMNPTAMMAWGVDKMHQASLAAISPDVTPELRQEYETEMAAYTSWLRSEEAKNQLKSGNQAGMAPFQALQNGMADQKLTTEEVQGVIDAIRKARGTP